MNEYKVAIVGGGPAGMISAITTAQNTNSAAKIALIEKTDSLGKKLLLTGGKRCNIANASPIKKQLEIIQNKNFLKHSFYTLDNKKLLAIFEKKGLEFKAENGKYFPVTDSSESVLNILKEYLNDLNIDILLNHNVNDIKKTKNGLFNIFLNQHVKDVKESKKDSYDVKTDKIAITSEYLILATGGFTYPQTGSSGDGYRIATELGHSITTPKPGLIPLRIKNNRFRELSGVNLEDIEVSCRINEDSKKTKNSLIKVAGNILFTHFGLSGPAILDLSNHIVENINQNSNGTGNGFNTPFKDVKLSLNLVPDLSREELNEKIVDDSKTYGKTKIKNYMKFYLKNSFINLFLDIANVDGDKTLSTMKKKDKKNIIAILKEFNVELDGLVSKDVGMITLGGVEAVEVNPKTMESKLIDGLYFAGELLDVHGPTGGYNLQIAFSTGYLAGKSLAFRINENSK